MTSECKRIDAIFFILGIEPFDEGLCSVYAETKEFQDLVYELAECHVEKQVRDHFPLEVAKYVTVLDFYVEEYRAEQYYCDIYIEANVALEFKSKKELNLFKLTHPDVYSEFVHKKVVSL